MHRLIAAIYLVMLLIVPQVSFAEKPAKSAILVVSFGTSVPEARQAIDNLVNTARKAFPDSEVRLAFTSNIIRRKIARESGDIIPNPVQALAQLNDEGFTDVIVMPTHIIPGEEFDEIAGVVEAFGGFEGKYGFKFLALGTPFLYGADDCDGMADVLIARFKAQLEDKETAIILMGHGTPEHFANALYSQLQLALDTKAYGRFFLGTVEAAPKIEDVIARLKRHPEVKKLILSPLMIVAGDHAHNDLAGEDDPESWLNVLKAAGYENISTYLVGLGQDENIARKFESKIREIMDDD
ncbi:MAG: sirohydrochlorin cobaltochelatase [Synergistaceae bacterium]|nr:sirohydrochlorin cobaltochelatase [Synergistaceae bacterium]